MGGRPRDWRIGMADFFDYIRARGWTCPFIVTGQSIRPIGIRLDRETLARVCRARNDNRRD